MALMDSRLYRGDRHLGIQRPPEKAGPSAVEMVGHRSRNAFRALASMLTRVGS